MKELNLIDEPIKVGTVYTLLVEHLRDIVTYIVEERHEEYLQRAMDELNEKDSSLLISSYQPVDACDPPIDICVSITINHLGHGEELYKAHREKCQLLLE